MDNRGAALDPATLAFLNSLDGFRLDAPEHEAVLRQLPASSGLFDRLSLTAAYTCTRDEMQRARAGYEDRPGGEMPEELKTMFHETMHLYQALTPYGMYHTLLIEFQTQQIARIVYLLKHEYRLPIRYPLIPYLETLRPARRYPGAWLALKWWYAAELMLRYFEAPEDKAFYDLFFEHPTSKRGPHLTRGPMLFYFAEMDGVLQQYLQGSESDFAYTGPGLNLHDVDTLYAEDRSLMTWGLLHGVAEGDRHFSMNVVDLLESGAEISEFWGETEMAGLQRIFRERAPTPSPYQVKYWRLHQMWKPDLLKTTSVEQHIATFGALVEVALFSPILPHYAALRHDKMRLKDIHPLNRFIHANFALGRVRPLRDFDDYQRFTDDLCHALEWPTLSETAERTLELFPGGPQNQTLRLYYDAMRFRAQVPCCFVDMNVWRRSDPLSNLFQYRFVHPVIDFTDRLLLHKDKPFLFHFAMQFVLSQYFRGIMFSRDPVVTLPYRCEDPEHLMILREMLGQYLETQLGLSQPVVKIQGMQ